MKMTNAGTMDVSEFSFMASVPRAEAKKIRSIWDRWEEVKEVIAARGQIIPLRIAARLAGVSRQRIDGLIEVGRLEKVSVEGRSYVLEDSFLEWVRSERKTGRPCGHGAKGLIEHVKLAVEVGREVGRDRKKK